MSDHWQPIATAPDDTKLLLGWWGTLYGSHYEWEQEVGLAKCTRGGWRHGRATHWRPLADPPALNERETPRA